MATAILDKSGEYKLAVGTRNGVNPGPYLVAVSIIKVVPPAIPGGTPGGRLISPRKYTNPKLSGLQADVRPGSNTFDFALVTSPQ